MKLKRREANLVGNKVRKKSCDHLLITLVYNDYLVLTVLKTPQKYYKITVYGTDCSYVRLYERMR